MKKITSILLFALLFPLSAQAFVRSCWVLTNLKGTAHYLSDGKKTVNDGFSHQIKIIFNGHGAVASGDSLPLYQAGNYTAIGANDTDEGSVVETYLINVASRRVLYTESIFATGILSKLTGTRMFSGNAAPCS